MKNFIKPLIFLTVLLLLGGIAYWDDWQTKQDEKIAASKDKLLTFQASSITAIEYLKNEGESPLRVDLAKEKNRWHIKQPNAFPADSESIDRWLKTIEDLRFEKKFEPTSANLQDYGLDKPKISLTLKDADGRNHHIEIGGKSPVGFSSYIKLNKQATIFLVSQHIYTASNKELQDFRDKSLGVPSPALVQRFNYQYTDSPLISLVRSDKEWRIESPRIFKADSEEVNSFLAFFERLKVERFLDKPSAELRKALDGSKRLALLQLQLEDASKVEYPFIENNGTIYTKLPNLDGYVSLDAKVSEGLKKSVRDFQYRDMFTFNSTDATKVILDGKTFEKNADHWLAVEDKKQADFVRLLLVDLEFAKAEQLLTPEQMGPVMQGKPLHTLSINFKDGQVLDLAVWKNPDQAETIYLRRDKDAFYLASAQLLNNFSAQEKPEEKAKVGDASEG